MSESRRPELEMIVRAMEAAAPDDCTLDNLRAMAARLHDAGLVGTATERFAMTPTATRLLMLDRDALRVSRDSWKGVAMRREKLHDELRRVDRVRARAAERIANAQAWTKDDWDEFAHQILADLDMALGSETP